MLGDGNFTLSGSILLLASGENRTERPARGAADGCTGYTRCMNERSGMSRFLSIRARVVELYRVDGPSEGGKGAPMPSKSPYSKRFEHAEGQAGKSASERHVARRMSLAESTVRGIDFRYLE